MKLKAVVASLVTLGLSGPVLAVSQPYIIDTSYQMDVMRDQVNKLDRILDRNQPGGFDQPCGWTCRINFSGWINTDAYLANRPPIFLGLNPLKVFELNQAKTLSEFLLTSLPILEPTSGKASDLILNNANLFVNARVNNWVTANMSMGHSSLAGIPGSNGPYNTANSLLIYHPLNQTSIDTAYATIGNFQVSPVYFRVGKQYLPFGAYDPYGFVTQDNPTTLLTETTAPAAQLGFVLPKGLYGSVYTFAGNPKISDAGSTRRIQNGGVDLGWGSRGCCSKFNVNAGYIANIADSNFLSSYYLNSIIEAHEIPGLPDQKVPAYNVNADVAFGPFDVNGHYVATTKSFRKPFLLGIPIVDFSQQIPETPAFPQEALPDLTFKKPKLWGLELGLNFPVVAHQSRLAIGYQKTTHLVGLLPKNRYYIDYMVNLAKWFDVGIAVFQNRDYSLNEDAIFATVTQPDQPPVQLTLVNGGTGNKSTTGQLRASIKFA